MTRRDNLLERLEQVNPVPDPSQLYEDLELLRHFHLADEQRRDKTMTDTKIDQLTPEPRRPRVRRGLLIGVATAALVIIAGAVVVFVGRGDTNGPADSVAEQPPGRISDFPLLQLTFDGEQCRYEGPSVLAAGEVEVVYHNESAERVWADFIRLDEGRTIQEVIAYGEEDPPNRDKPTWSSNVYWHPGVPANGSSYPSIRTLQPGLHALVCGTWNPWRSYFGSGLTLGN